YYQQADAWIEILPCNAFKREMSTGVSYGEDLVYDIERLERHFPAVPVKNNSNRSVIKSAIRLTESDCAFFMIFVF
ncbi:MAG: hypothetical protein JXA42_10360, partial [Anaerolineales bacterium]|nr:hypothetical protein [Anaerolineales bacterium]